MDSLIPAGMILIGIVLGVVASWLVFSGKARRSYAVGEANSKTEIATLNERLAAKDRELQKLQGAFDNEVAELARVTEENSHLNADLVGERRAAQERSESFKRVTEELAEKFKALSRDALKDNNQSFLELARATLENPQETAKGDLELKQRAIDQLVKPLKNSLEKVDGKIGELENALARAYSELLEQIRALASTPLQL